MIFKTLILILTSLLFISCSSNKNEPTIKKKAYPTWYEKPISNSYLYLYGIGRGETIEEATKNALVDLSSKVSLTITSTQTSSKKSYFKYREYVEKNIESNIYSQTENLRFNNYKVDKTYKIKYDEFIVRVKVEREQLIENLTNEISTLIKEFNIDEKINSSKDFLTKYQNYKYYLNKFYSQISKVEILKSLTKESIEEYDDSLFIKKLDISYTKMSYLKSNITFNLINEDYTVFSKKVLNELTENGFAVDSIKSDYSIKLSSNINTKTPKGFFIVDNLSSVKIYYKDKLLISKNFLSKGVSSNSVEDAINDSFQNLNLEPLNTLL